MRYDVAIDISTTSSVGADAGRMGECATGKIETVRAFVAKAEEVRRFGKVLLTGKVEDEIG